MFGELPEYYNLWDTFIMLLQSSLGDWNFKIYDDLSIGSNVGVLFHVIVILMNLVLLLNLVITILSDTYSKLSYQSRGLFYDGLVSAIPAYNYDKHYGALIITAPPFNLLVIPLIPVFLCI